MKKTILIVEDQQLNVKILCKILETEYEIVAAENGKDALDILKIRAHSISCILLDIVMPVMNGFEFMEKIHNTEYQSIPIIVMTGSGSKDSEKEALDAGAWDYVRKPYEKEIVQKRIRNVISRSQNELLEKLKYTTTHDSLTGLYNRNYMFQETKRVLEINPNELFVFMRFDLKRFHLINSFYGEEVGNQVLYYISENIIRIVKGKKRCVYGRVAADVFCICAPYDRQKVALLISDIKEALANFQKNVLLEPAIGLFLIKDRNLPIETMYDRASMAAQKCKTKFAVDFVYYDESMTKSLRKSQEIMSEMKQALADEQFQIYFQPKYSLKTGNPCGAEALVRWIHPEKGIISPCDFIPVFEQNGFINQFDFYVWNKVCQIIRRWIDEGKDPNPISVNISRVDMYHPQIVQQIEELVRSYHIPTSLFQLELTESAYMDNPELMKKNVAQLQKQGFTVLMDDFGSGYSSLNTLKDIPVDILKIDLKFLQKSIQEGRSEKILASVVRMAYWLDLPVIVEGVETEQQKDFLLSIGCGFVQGYYFAKPMPVKKYEELVAGSQHRKELKNIGENKKLIDSIWNENPQIDLLFKSMRQPVIIFEENNGRLTPIRVNEAYTMIFHLDKIDLELFFDELTSVREKENFDKALTEAYDSLKISECEIHRYDSKMQERIYRVETKFIGDSGVSKVFFVALTDVTEQRQLEEAFFVFQQILQKRNAKKKILVVEDTEVGRAILAQTFREEYSLLLAADGKQALALFMEHMEEIAIVLLDIEMPIMDGREFLRQKEKIDVSQKVPVIIISSDHSEEEQKNMLKHGVNDYVTKPFIPEVVAKRVKNVLEYHHTFRLLLKEYHRDRYLCNEANTNL